MVLLEVIIALTIFTVVAFSLVKLLDAAFTAARERNEIDGAVRGLANQMVLLHQGQLIPVDEDLPVDGSGILYHLSIAPEPLQDQNKRPVGGEYRATITAKWSSSGQPMDRSISELVYRP